MLFDAVHSVIGQLDRVVIVDNGSDPAIVPEHWGMAERWEGGKVGVIRYDEDPPNISRLWNVGLDVVEEAIRSAGEDEWDVAVLNSDVVVPAQDRKSTRLNSSH